LSEAEAGDFIERKSSMPNKGTCKAETCDKDVRAKGYCDRHYRQWRKGLLGKSRYNTCVAENCRKPRARRSLCAEHFAQKHAKAAAAPPAEAAAPAAE
jgi:hypothetical protein